MPHSRDNPVRFRAAAGILALALLRTLTGCSATAGWIYFGVYFVARTLHTVFYLNAVQPWRTVAFFVGQLAQLGIMVQLLIAVL